MARTAVQTNLTQRPRRLRRTAGLRALTRQTRWDAGGLVAPLFVRPGANIREPIASLPGQYRLSPDALDREVDRLVALGLGAVLLFGVPGAKDAAAREAYADDGIVQTALRRLRARHPGLVLITDVCLCAYTDHGHCGVVRDGAVDNDDTLDLLARTATSHAAAGADVVAPSAMMDGQVGAIRAALDDAGFPDVAIMGYSAKYASVFYGPFRDAQGSAPQFGDRRGYQMDPPNAREALREIALDLAEGADIVMVKPALCYLDVIRAAREAVTAPLAAYWVSGEYAMVKAAAAAGWLDERHAVLEVLTAIRRAGADIIITYAAADALRWLREEA
ncbi:MAG: porphobilinogen synthase [Armatimonadota bacterium]|nr:porphobilinogen synthase [Armatimonadota bacterium]MDR7532877.1 porphobilinogen synthase [Armatimonadota bacterium]MDR7536084.1 porphobilinogen synthase [Armatimonadota bacterium]